MLHVSAGIVIQDHTILIAQRPEGKHLAGYWEFPGGKIEAGEKPETTLVREFQEEFGVQIRVLRKFHENVHHYADGAVTLHTYLAIHENGNWELREHAALRWVTPNNLMNFPLAPADLPIARKWLEEQS